MKKISGVVVAVVLGAFALAGFSGCAPKSEPKVAVASEARQMLIDGTGFLKQGDVVKAVQSFATAIKTEPDYFEAYFMLAETFIHLKQFDQAQSVLNAATIRFPGNPDAHYLLAIAFEGAGKLMPAIVSVRTSIDLYQVTRDEAGEKRATVLLGVLVQMAKQQSESKMVDNAAQDATKAAGH